MFDRTRKYASGQILVLFTLALVALLVMAGLVIEGGNVLGQQRIAQNGSDAAANAGALVIAEDLSGSAKTGQDVLSAVSAMAAANGLGDIAAEYTDGFGNGLGIPVASGPIPEAARGVNVGGARTVQTSLIRVVGINDLTASADATAVAGALSAFGTGALPVTFPTTFSQCTNGLYQPGDSTWEKVDANFRDDANMSTVPLCKTDPGAFGWLDLGDGNLADQIVYGPGPGVSIPIPTWLQTQTGNSNAVEDAINDNYADRTVLIPMFDGTCRVDPGDASTADTCPEDKRGTDPSGNNTWYHIPYFASFWIYQAYIKGANAKYEEECLADPGTPEVIDATPPGFLGCIKGWFVDWVYEGPVDPNRAITDNTAIAIQLIR